jgi:3-oxoacyl-[acyl-carrier protein] reductase
MPLAEGGGQAGEGQAIYVAGKAHDNAHQDEAVARTMEAFGRIDYLFNKSVRTPVVRPCWTSTSPWSARILDINVVSAFEWTQRVYRAWMKSNGGAVRQRRLGRGLPAGPRARHSTA